MRYIFSLFMIVGLLFFSGCSLKEIEKPITKYTLLSNLKVKKSDFTVDKILKIERFKSLKFLHSDEIWYQKSDYEMNSYVYSCWSGDFSLLAEKNIANVIYKSHIFKTVFQGHSRIKPDFILEGNILQAIQNVSKDGSVLLSVRLYLVDKKDAKVLGSKEFRYVKKCKSVDAKGAVDAYNEIIKKLDKDVVLWIKQLMKIN